MAAGLVADRDRHPGQLRRVGNVRVGRHEHRRRSNGIGVWVKLPVPDRGRDVDGPMTGAVNVEAAPALEGLVGADLVAEVVQLAVREVNWLLNSQSSPSRSK